MPSANIITIMADLSKEYKVLKPKLGDKISCSELSAAFHHSVLRVSLFLLADIGVIPFDI
jgi:hypothetical protein